MPEIRLQIDDTMAERLKILLGLTFLSDNLDVFASLVGLILHAIDDGQETIVLGATEVGGNHRAKR